MKLIVALVATLLTLAVVWGILQLNVPVETLLMWGIAAACLVWLVGLVTIPWNLYFRAHYVLAELQATAATGETVDPARMVEVRAIARKTLAMSIVAHLASALVISVIAHLAGRVEGFYFAGFYLLSTLFRPGFEYFRHLHRRLGRVLDEVTQPYLSLRSLSDKVTSLAAELRFQREDRDRLVARVEQLQAGLSTRADEHEKKLAAVARHFEETVDRLTDNREVIAGLKAFLRLVRDGSM
jgi:hypothetical protein